MSTRRAQSMPPAAAYEKAPRGRCLSAICVSWKVFTCVLSHVLLVALVVAYCWMGAITFEHLEAGHEREVKAGIKYIRGNLTESIWMLTHKEAVLYEQNWTEDVVSKLQTFEKEIYNSMKLQGWDGNEDANKIQWTRTGALFYSIIVITTIGYGHIAPKTPLGKVSTICYAILGIPLMLLCLSNIGDIMASSFRFIYWRVCCFVCTRDPRRNPSRRSRRGVSEPNRTPQRLSAKSQASMRRSIRVSQRTNDSGIDNYYEPRMQHAHSDTELRYNSPDGNNWERHSGNNRTGGGKNPRPSRAANREQFLDRHTVERDRNVAKTNRYQHPATNSPITRGRASSQRPSRAQSMAPDHHQPSRGHREAPPSRPLNTMTLPASYGRHHNNKQRGAARDVRAHSLDPRGGRLLGGDASLQMSNFEFDDTDGKAPIFCNKYAIDEMDNIRPINNDPAGGRRGSLDFQHRMASGVNRLLDPLEDDEDEDDERSFRGASQQPPPHQRNPSPTHHPQQQHQSNAEYYANHHQHDTARRQSQSQRSSQPQQLYRPADEREDDFDMHPIRQNKRRERPPPMPSPRIMTPMGFAIHRQARLHSAVMDDDDMYGDWDPAFDHPSSVRPVPIWLCVFLVVSYIIAGAFLFSQWENWSFLDSAYFCFITLTTIGFGDFVPAQGVQKNAELSIAFCSLYLLFGIALLAMSFNLVQEEVIANVKNVARQLGILKEEETDY